jgi:peptidoglycan hydrolase-like protein with peptidoglycan-binding domain
MMTVLALGALVFVSPLAVAPASAADWVPWAKVQRGDSGLNVRAVQTLLRDRGYNVQLTDHFRYGTEHAVKAFQDSHGLEVTGVVDKTTWPELVVVVQRGDAGQVVKVVQRQLAWLQYYHAVVGGHFGPKTEAAVKEFQESWGLVQTGAMNVFTWRHLIHSIGFPSCLMKCD